MTKLITYQRSAFSFLLLLLSYQVTAQKKGDVNIRFSLEQAISSDYQLSSIGIHPEIFRCFQIVFMRVILAVY